MIQFDEMGFTPGILKSLQGLGFDTPMPVQAKVIPIMLQSENDIIALAQTGTGKTAAFGLPLVQQTDTQSNSVQSLVLCPTRELCMQITQDLADYSAHIPGIKVLPVYGGASIEKQIRELKKGVHIVVATPGRLIDLIGRGAVKLGKVSTVVLDEADEMLNMGFLDSINEILEEVPEGRRTLLFSATMSPEIGKIAGNYMSNPTEVTIGQKNSSAENLIHNYYMVHSRDKYKVLKRIADYEPGIYGIVFCRTRIETQDVASKLLSDGYNADALHGDLSQAQRDAVMKKFRSRKLSFLVATDVAARGLDVDDITHVINYSLPEDTEVYTHRCGRTGRAGKSGISLSLVQANEKQYIRKIEKKLGKTFNLLQVPGRNEICGKQLNHWADKLEKVTTDNIEVQKFLPEIALRLENMDKEDLVRKVIGLEFERLFNDYRNEEEFTVTENSKSDKKDAKERKSYREKTEESYSRLFINLGKSDGFYPDQLINLVNTNTKGRKVPIGKIDLLRNFSFFEVGSKHADDLIGALSKTRFMGKKVELELAKEKAGRQGY